MGGDVPLMSVGDIHNREGRIASTTSKIKESDYISDHNRQLLLDFKAYLEAEDLSQDRIARYLYNWYQLLEKIDWPLDQVEKDQLIELVGKINQDKIRDKELSPYTKMEYKKAIRKFYVHFWESKEPDFDGEQLCDFFTLTVNTKDLDPERLPNPQTVRKLVYAASCKRDKAFIMTLWSSAGRVGEVLGLQWKDISFKNRKGEEIAKIKFRDTKTGGSRTVPLRAGYIYLKELQDSDPRSGEPDTFIFRNKVDDTQLSHNAATSIISRARDQTDIPEKVKTNPHAFRKGRATYLAAKGMNQPQLAAFGGWAQGSSHLSRYIRLAEADVESGVKELYDMENSDKEVKEDVEPIQCHECQELNKFEAETCKNCGENIKSSKLFKEVQVKETKEELKTRMIRDNIGLDDEELDEAAEDLVKDKMNY